MKKVWSMIMAVVIAVALVGCGNEPGNAGNERKKTYTFATWAAGTELQEFQQIIDKVNENANGEYTIEVLSIPSDYYVKLSTKIAAKKSPDFF